MDQATDMRGQEQAQGPFFRLMECRIKNRRRELEVGKKWQVKRWIQLKRGENIIVFHPIEQGSRSKRLVYFTQQMLPCSLKLKRDPVL